MEDIRDYNQLKMLKAFADTQMSSTDMLGTTGYGLWDTGRAKLEQIFAEVMGAEDALVRSQFQSGTHTLAVALFGLLRAGDTLLAATGRPYDTLEGVIGLDGKGKGTGTLMDYGIKYDEAPLKADFTPDYELIAQKAPGAKVCHIQRSRGYLQRNAFDLDTIRKVADTARAANPDIIIFVDNCYGEFTQKEEPCQAGADLVVGSLIKNPGGGITPTGGYIAGRKDLVEKCSHRFTAPGIGGDLGCTQDSLRDTFLGFYYAPGVVCEALKTATRVAVPGCHATGFIAPVAPLVELGIIPKAAHLNVTSLTGYSGGGKKMIAEYEAERTNKALNAPRPYGLALHHKHLPEMAAVTGLDTAPNFVPVVADYYAGMETMIPLDVTALGVSAPQVASALAGYYAGQPMVKVHPLCEGTDGGFLAANKLAGKDTLEIYCLANPDGTRMQLISLFDNLGKGSSGTAVQCMNLMLGLEETRGLAR